MNHLKARQILVTFHDTLPRRGPTQPTIGLTVDIQLRRNSAIAPS